MQATFFRAAIFPPPAACPEFLSGFNGARARCASNAGIATVVEGVVMELVLLNVCPYVVPCPVEQGVELVQAVALIPFLNLQCLSCIGLFMPKPGDPCLFPSQCAAERNHLADFAALLPLRHAPIEPVYPI